VPEQELRPNILVLTSTLPRWPGDATPAFVLDLCRELTRDFAVHVLAPHAMGARRREDMDGVSVHRFRYLPATWESLAYDGGIPERLRRQPLALLQVPFFLIAQFFTTLWLVWTLRPKVIHAHWILPQGVVALLASGISPGRPPALCTVHGTDLYGLNAGPLRWLKVLVLGRMAAVAVVSDAMRAGVVALGVSPVKLQLAPMGVDTEAVFYPPPEGSRRHDTAVFAGRLVAGKGVDILLRAWARISMAGRPLRLVIVGDGPERAALESLAQKLDLRARVEFTGALPQAALADQFRAAGIAVFPFTGIEGLGLVVAEAQACGCPVIASEIPAMRDLIVPEVTGLITPPGDAGALAQALERVLLDAGLAERIARAGRAAAQEKFSWTVAGDRYRELLRELIRDGQGNPE
jgi:glycosyltransferase involved in cell wall biosynthesis